ncbi:hypothetical protein niasHS_014995 [Heterodera schachtii]|uniref:Uncharacterized protein n=1 Tax=Heterodera schachtii TaxID=97005 RepID=A0ABD2I8I6_HETSC
MMFTYWPRPAAPCPSPPFAQLSLPDLFDLDMAQHHQSLCRSSALFAPHSFPKGIDSGFCHCQRRNESTENTRSIGTQTDGDAFSNFCHYSSEEDRLDDPQLANLCAQLAQRLMDIADGWASELELMSSEKSPEGIFGRILAHLFRLW